MNISCVKNSDCTVCKHKYDMQIESENKKQGSVLYIFGGGGVKRTKKRTYVALKTPER